MDAEQVQATAILQIEEALKRVRGKNTFGPRSIDLDIMLFDDEILDIGHRHIPNPEIYERAFIAIALAEISPNKIHPETGERMDVIASRFSADNWGMIRRSDISLMPGKAQGPLESEVLSGI